MRYLILRIKCIVIMTLTLFICMSSANAYAYANDELVLHNGGSSASAYFGKDFSKLDLTGSYDLLTQISFDNYTKWPSKDKLPKDFDPLMVLEWGKNPGLGLKELHKRGFTGKGVVAAYVDQALLPGHIEYDKSNIKYIVAEEKKPMPSMHGPAVVSILAGENVGVAPDASVYYFAAADEVIKTNDSNEQHNHTANGIAKGILKAVEINKSLPKEQKIRILGISFGSQAEEYVQAKKTAEENGIMVFDVGTLENFSTVSIKPFLNKDDYKNYFLTYWYNNAVLDQNEALFCPTGGETIASGISNGGDAKADYAYYEGGGMSWAVPYLEGVIALGLQVDPKLTKENAIKYLYASANKIGNVKIGGIINPSGFLELVKKNAITMKFNHVPGDKEYYYFLYNSSKVNHEDILGIKKYADGFKQKVYLKDVASYVTYTEKDLSSVGQTITNKSFKSLYQDLKEEVAHNDGILKGIQIFGSIEQVPPYSIDSSLMNSDTAIDEMGVVSTDLFYSNFKNDASIFSQTIKTRNLFDGTVLASINPQWKVARLPLKSGEYSRYFNNYYLYNMKIREQGIVPLVNFNNPIFPSENHIDDTAYFLNRLNKEFYILDNHYRLYGNLDGKYPIGTQVIGNFNKENLSKENSLGVADFFFETHGQPTNIDQAIFDTDNKEQRISLVNNENINSVFDKNFYTLNLWTCNNGWSLRNDTIVHEALAKGKCISAIAASSTISNRGIDNKATLGQMKNNNYFYFQLLNYQSQALNNSKSDSFFYAQQGYIDEILLHKEKVDSGYYDYQFNIHNAMSVHYFGLLEQEFSNKRFMDFSNLDDKQESKAIFNGNISFDTEYANGGFQINNFKAEKVGSDVVFTFDYNSTRDCDYSVFNPPKGDKTILIVKQGIKKGINTSKFTFNATEFNQMLEADLITMRIGFDDKANFIFFHTSQLRSLLNQAPIKVTENTETKVVSKEEPIIPDAAEIALEKITFSVKAITVNKGTTTIVKAYAHYSDGSKVKITNGASWISNNVEVLTVENGVIKAISAGRCYLKVDYQGVSSSLLVISED